MAKYDENYRKELEDNIETGELLDAIDCLDEIRGYLVEKPELKSSKLMEDLVRLHETVYKFIEEGVKPKEDILELAAGISDVVYEISENAAKILNILDRLAGFDDDSYDDGDFEADDEDDDDKDDAGLDN